MNAKSTKEDRNLIAECEKKKAEAETYLRSLIDRATRRLSRTTRPHTDINRNTSRPTLRKLADSSGSELDASVISRMRNGKPPKTPAGQMRAVRGLKLKDSEESLVLALSETINTLSSDSLTEDHLTAATRYMDMWSSKTREDSLVLRAKSIQETSIKNICDDLGLTVKKETIDKLVDSVISTDEPEAAIWDCMRVFSQDADPEAVSKLKTLDIGKIEKTFKTFTNIFASKPVRHNSPPPHKSLNCIPRDCVSEWWTLDLVPNVTLFYFDVKAGGVLTDKVHRAIEFLVLIDGSGEFSIAGSGESVLLNDEQFQIIGHQAKRPHSFKALTRSRFFVLTYERPRHATSPLEEIIAKAIH